MAIPPFEKDPRLIHDNNNNNNSSTDKGSSLDVSHLEFSSSQSSGESECQRYTAAQGQYSVDHNSILGSLGGKCGVEVGPQHPQEEGSKNREEIRLVGGGAVSSVLSATFGIGVSQRERETKIGAKSENEDGSSQILSVQL